MSIKSTWIWRARKLNLAPKKMRELKLARIKSKCVVSLVLPPPPHHHYYPTLRVTKRKSAFGFCGNAGPKNRFNLTLETLWFDASLRINIWTNYYIQWISKLREPIGCLTCQYLWKLVIPYFRIWLMSLTVLEYLICHWKCKISLVILDLGEMCLVWLFYIFLR